MTAIIDGQVKWLVDVCSVEVEPDKFKTSWQEVGDRGTRHRSIGWSGKARGTLYDVSSDWAEYFINYANTGRDLYFSVNISWLDIKTNLGVQSISLLRCNLDTMVIAKLNANEPVTTTNFSFTYEKSQMLASYLPTGRLPYIDRQKYLGV